MSWVKVKKINSDLSTPLDTLINNKSYGTNYTDKTPVATNVITTTADWTTVVEVSGRGRAIAAFSGAVVTVRITVDGVVLAETPADTSFVNTATRVYGSTSISNRAPIVENYGVIFDKNNDNTNPNPPPAQMGPWIGFKTSFKFEIRRNFKFNCIARSFHKFLQKNIRFH